MDLGLLKGLELGSFKHLEVCVLEPVRDDLSRTLQNKLADAHYELERGADLMGIRVKPYSGDESPEGMIIKDAA